MSLIINTTTNVWEMDKGFDIILFIDKNTVCNSEYFENEVFRRINAKYPFEKLLTKCGRNKSTAGSVLIYSVYGETICCMFLNAQQQREQQRTAVSCHQLRNSFGVPFDVEQGLRTIRDRLAGYRYVAVQLAPAMYDFELVFRMVFRKDNGELWLCGGFKSPYRPSAYYDAKTNPAGFVAKNTKNKCLKVIDCKPQFDESPKQSEYMTIEIKPIELQSNDSKTTSIRNQKSPSIKIISQNIWDIDTEIDIILFINMEIMYMDHWIDEVVERVNDRYHFKEKLLEDIQFMPLAPGSIRMYRLMDVSIYCIFFSNSTSIFSNWMEDALINMKQSLAGDIHLAIQQNPALSEFRFNVYSNFYYLLQSVFAYDTVTIWWCGGL